MLKSPNTNDNNKFKHEKCFKCGARVKSIDVIQCTCRCKKIFCKTHIFAAIRENDKSHACSYDYVTDAQNLIKNTNPIINHNLHRSNITDI